MKTTTGFAIGSALTLGLVGSFYLHWGQHSSTLLLGLAGVSSFSLPALVGLWFVAWRSGLPLMRLSAVGTALVYLASFFSFGSVIGCGPTAPEGDPVVIYSHNVGGLNSSEGDPGSASQVAEAIVAYGADIIVLQEVRASFADDLASISELAEYRYRATEPSDNTNMLIWSRWPLGDSSTAPLIRSDQSRNTLLTSVDAPQGSFLVRNIHLNAPLNSSAVDIWQRQLERLAVDGKTYSGGPLVLAGDFNATESHHQFREVLDGAFSDVHSLKGCGPDTTWPASFGFLPSVLRLDHVLITDDFVVREVKTGQPSGSDHRPIITVLEFKSTNQT